MSRAGRDPDLRLKGMGLGGRFALTMTLALSVVLGLAGVLLYTTLTSVAENILQRELNQTVLVNSTSPEWVSISDVGHKDPETGVERHRVRYDGVEGSLYRVRGENDRGDTVTLFELIVPARDGKVAKSILGLLVGILFAVILAGAGVAYWVASQVTQPIQRIVTVVRQVAKGELTHSLRVKGGGEVELLARAVERMTGDLESAQEAELELSIREREMGVAGEVREALLPLGTPDVPGYDVGSAHFASEKSGGDWHDFLPLPGGRLGVLVCDVSGQGVPAALVGATARAYLRSELSRGGDVAEAFYRVNTTLGRDVRRGMFVTALYLVLDPATGTATVVCAGHKVPLLKISAEDGKLRAIHPEGIALGLDKGPVFERTLEAQEIAIDPGDRIVLANSGPLRIAREDGEELGEKRFYSLVLKHASLETPQMIKGLRRSFEKFSGEEMFPADISLVTLRREV